MDDENLVRELQNSTERLLTGVERDHGRLDRLEKNVKQLAIAVQRPQIGNSSGGTFFGGDGADAELERKALNAFARHAMPQERLQSFLERNGEFKALSVGTDPQGGFSVLPTFSTAIMELQRLISPVRSHARVETIGSDAFEELQSRDNAAVAWVGETSARTVTDNPTLAKIRVPVHELMAMPAATQTILDDASFNVEDWLARKIAESFAAEEGTQFCNGNGVSKPRGLLTYPTAATGDATRAWAVFEHVATGVNGAFAASATAIDVFHETISKLKPRYLTNAKWFMTRSVRAAVGKLKDSTNRSLVQDSLALGQPDSILGYPLVIIEDMPALATNSLSVGFGDMRQTYIVIDRAGLRVLRDPYTNKPNVLFYSTVRRGGDVQNFESLKFIKASTA